MTNEEVFSRAYDEVQLRGLSPKTVESYLGRLKLFLKYFNNQPIEEPVYLRPLPKNCKAFKSLFTGQACFAIAILPESGMFLQ